jgi:hypothetical protein
MVAAHGVDRATVPSQPGSRTNGMSRPERKVPANIAIAAGPAASSSQNAVSVTR